MDMEILSEEMRTYVLTNELDYSDSNAQAEAQKAYIKNLREKATKNGGSLEISTSTNDGADKAKVQIDKRNLIITGPNQEGEPCKEIYDDKSNLTFSKNEKNGVERQYNYDEEGKCTGGQEIIPDGELMVCHKLDALGKYVLDEKEQECAKDLNLDINSLSAAQILQIRYELMYKKPQPKQEEENKGQQEDPQPEQEEKTFNVSEIKDDVENTYETSIVPYDREAAVDFFTQYAKDRDWTFNQDVSSSCVSGDFTDENGEGQGRVRVKDDDAASDIKGIEALVLYAQKCEYESITLGKCSEAYAAEMKRICEEHGMTLIIKEEVEQSHEDEQEQLFELPDNPQDTEVQDEEFVLNKDNTPDPDGEEQKQEDDSNKQEEEKVEIEDFVINADSPKIEPITVEEDLSQNSNNQEMEMPTYQIVPTVAGMRMKMIMQQCDEKGVDEFEAETKKSMPNKESNPDEQSEFLMKKYVIGMARGDKEMISNAEKALQYYGVDTISCETPTDEEGNKRYTVNIDKKPFSDRTPQEQADIKACHDTLVPSKKDKANTSDNDRYFNSKGSDRDR